MLRFRGVFAAMARPAMMLRPSAVVVPSRSMASKKHKKMIKLAKGYIGRANRCFRIALQRVEKAWLTAYRGRKEKKRSIKRLWIQRINAGSRAYGVPYNRLIAGLHSCNIELNRNVLSNLAMTEPLSFKAVIDVTAANDPYLSVTRHIKVKTHAEENMRMLLEKFGENDGLDLEDLVFEGDMPRQPGADLIKEGSPEARKLPPFRK